MITAIRLIFLSLIMIASAQLFGDSRMDCPANINYNGTANILGQMPYYYVDFTLMTKNGEKTISYPPCTKSDKFDRLNWTWCEKAYGQTVSDIEMTEVAPGIYAYEVKFSMKPENSSVDPFCSRIYDNIVVTDYQGEKDSRSFLVSANKNEVIGVLFTIIGNDFAQVALLQVPCKDWNNLVNSTKYKQQGLYPACGNYTE